jgi:hypothetical protein
MPTSRWSSTFPAATCSGRNRERFKFRERPRLDLQVVIPERVHPSKPFEVVVTLVNLGNAPTSPGLSLMAQQPAGVLERDTVGFAWRRESIEGDVSITWQRDFAFGVAPKAALPPGGSLRFKLTTRLEAPVSGAHTIGVQVLGESVSVTRNIWVER